MTKLEEIARAWAIAHNPTEEQKEKAALRIKVCNACEKFKFHEYLKFYYCEGCGCPIGKKIHTPINNACPLKKWDWEKDK